MQVLSYEPGTDSFFVGTTWDEYRRLDAKYQIKNAQGLDTNADEVIEEFKLFLEEQMEGDSETFSYQQYIKDLYGTSDMPDACLIVSRDLSNIEIAAYDVPFDHMWGGFSPWKVIEIVEIACLSELAELECMEKEQDTSPDWERESAASGYKDASSGQNPSGRPLVEDMIKSAIREMLGHYNLHWSRKELTPQKLGTFCEYYAKMALLSYGVNIYTPEIDDHGVDFVAEGRNGFLKFQVKSTRLSSTYVFMQRKYFDIEDDAMFLFLILLSDGEHPRMYIIPTSAWRQESTVFVSRNYDGKKSKPEHGVNVSRKNMREIEKYAIEKMLSLF